MKLLLWEQNPRNFGKVGFNYPLMMVILTHRFAGPTPGPVQIISSPANHPHHLCPGELLQYITPQIACPVAGPAQNLQHFTNHTIPTYASPTQSCTVIRMLRLGIAMFNSGVESL